MRVPEHSYIAPRNVRPMTFATDAECKAIAEGYKSLEKIGICLDGVKGLNVHKMANAVGEFIGLGMDADLTPPLTTASITTPVQFLQAWLPGFVNIVTAARRIDELVGIVTQGNWEDEEIVQGVLERVGNAIPYGDYTNVPLSSWNVNYERRTIRRFEEGLVVGRLEEARAAAIRANSAESKREASAIALEIERNRVGFFGFNDGAGRTYGFLNDPQLPAYITAPNGSWPTSPFLDIQQDLLTAYQQLRTQSQDLIDSERDEITLAVATNSRDFLARTSDFGISVMQWLKETYPRTRVVSAPELNNANGGQNVFYLYAETVSESGSDDNRTFIQVVPQRFMTLGVDQRSKNYEEDYSNATAGIMTKRPYAVVRFTNI